MTRSILTGPAVLPAHASPLLHSRRFMVFHDKENEYLGSVAKMTDAELQAVAKGDGEEFRKVVLAGTKEFQAKMSTLVEEHGVLKKANEDMRKALEDSTKSVTEQASKIITLEKSLLRARANREPGEDNETFLKRAFPDECKAVGEAVRKKVLDYMVQKAESTATLAPAQSQTFDSTIYALVVQDGAFRVLDTHPMGAGVENMIRETSEPDFLFVAENGEFPEVALGLAPVGSAAKKIGGIIRISIEALQDTDFDLGAYVATKFARAGARRADYVAFRSNGTADAINGGFTGIVNAGVATVAAAGHTSIPLCTYDEIWAFMLSLGQAVLENPNSCWFGNPTTIAQLGQIKNQIGTPIFLDAGKSPAYGAIGTIGGYRVQPVSQMPALPGAGMPALAFGDPKAFAMGIRKDYTFDFSDHAGFTAGQRVYRGYLRLAAKMKDSTKIGVFKTAAA